jgi:S1-C subfamily serine protease
LSSGYKNVRRMTNKVLFLLFAAFLITNISSSVNADQYTCTDNNALVAQIGFVDPNAYKRVFPKKVVVDPSLKKLDLGRGYRNSFRGNPKSFSIRSGRHSYSVKFDAIRKILKLKFIWGNAGASGRGTPDVTYALCRAAVQKKIPKPSLLKTAFTALSKSDRKRIQTNLGNLDLYKSSVDGLYGKGTAAALSAYNKKNLNNFDLKNAANVSRLLAAVISHKFLPDPENFATLQKPKVPNVVPKPIPKKVNKRLPDETRKVASGTGFYVSVEGHIITNHHVIDGCQEIKVHSKGKLFDTVKIASDAQNDLALLKVGAKPPHVFALSPNGSFPLQDIIVAGFPFGNRVSSTLKFTKGIVSSVAGLGNNYSEIQIDAALQPGNSGGPIIDDYGNVIAVAVSKLDMRKVLKDYGVIPENTNFGVKASVVKNLMQGNSVQFKKPNTDVISKSELSKSVTNGTVYLTCWMTTAQIRELKKRKVMFSEFED